MLQKGENGTCVAHVLGLEGKPHNYSSVTVVKDSVSALRKDLRYHAKDICTVGVGTEASGESSMHFMQTQRALAYAMT
eukprot:6610707-Karenia_brevis.AAC.1